jgi:hypothetical protein
MTIWILRNLLLVFSPACTAQFIPDNDDYQDDLSFLDVAMDRGENARLCVCQISNRFHILLGSAYEDRVSGKRITYWNRIHCLGNLREYSDPILYSA